MFRKIVFFIFTVGIQASLLGQVKQDSVKVTPVSSVGSASYAGTELIPAAEDSSGVRVWRTMTPTGLKNYVLSVDDSLYRSNDTIFMRSNLGVLTFIIDRDQYIDSVVRYGSPDTLLFYFNSAAGVTRTDTVPLTATGGGGATDITIGNRTATTFDVESSTGTNGTVPSATSSLAGAFPAADKTKVDFVSITQPVDLDAVEGRQNDLITLSGVAANSTNNGTYTGTTIPDNQTTKQNIQSLETAVETKQSSTLTDGQILIGNGSNVATGRTMSGDATISNTGVVTIAANSIDSSNIVDKGIHLEDLNASGASDGQVPKWNAANQAWEPAADQTGAGGSGITSLNGLTATVQTFSSSGTIAVTSTTDDHALNVASSSLDSTHIKTQGISGANLKNNTIDNTKILNGTITSDDIAVSGISGTSLAPSSVGTTAIADGGVSYADIQGVTASRLLGNPTGGVAPPSEISLGTGIGFSGSSLVNTIATTSTSQNFVYAGPSSGAGTPSFRLLVSGDIPTLSITSKTSGTLTISRGGTNNTTFTTGRLNYFDGTKIASLTIGSQYQGLRVALGAASHEYFTYTAGAGMSIVDAAGTKTFTNTGDTNAADDLTTSTSWSGDLSGTGSSPTVAKIQNIAVSATPPTTGQILKYNGSVYAPAADDTAAGGGDDLGDHVADDTLNMNTFPIENLAHGKNDADAVRVDQIPAIMPQIGQTNNSGNGLADFFYSGNIHPVYFDTLYRYDTIQTTSRIKITAVDATADTFNINWKGIPKFVDTYTDRYPSVDNTVKWHFQTTNGGTTLGRIDSVRYREDGNHCFYYTMINGTDPSATNNVTFYNGWLGVRTANDTLDYPTLGIPLLGSFDGGTVQYYEEAANWMRPDGRIYSLINIDYSSYRTTYLLHTDDDGKKWTWTNDTTEFLKRSDFTWTTGTPTLIITSEAFRLTDTPYMNKIVILGAVRDNGLEDRDWYMIIDDDLNVIKPPTEINYSGYASTQDFRMLSFAKWKGRCHVMTWVNDGSASENDPTIHFIFDSFTDFENGNWSHRDTFYLGTRQDPTTLNLWADAVDLVPYNGKLNCLYESKDNNNTTVAWYNNRMMYLTALDEAVDTFPLSYVPVMINAWDVGWYGDGSGDWQSDHLGGKINTIVKDGKLFLGLTMKGEDQADDYYRAIWYQLWNKNNIKSEDLAPNSVTTEHIVDGEVGWNDLAQAVKDSIQSPAGSGITSLGGQTGATQTFSSSTLDITSATNNHDFEVKSEILDSTMIKNGSIALADLAAYLQIGGYTDLTADGTDTLNLAGKNGGTFALDMTAISTSTTLVVNSPNNVLSSTYVIMCYNVTGSDDVIFPANFYQGDNSTAMGTKTITADTQFACHYYPSGMINASARYICKW